MKVKIYEIVNQNDPTSLDRKLCWVEVNKTEALQLIQSLTNQLVADNPNSGRLESRCKGDCTEFSIAVI